MDHRTHPAVRENHNPWKITIFAYGGAPIRENMIFRMQVLTSPARENKILKKNQINGNPNSLFRHSAATAAPTATIARSGRGARRHERRWACRRDRRGGDTAPAACASVGRRREWLSGGGDGGAAQAAASSSSSAAAAAAPPLPRRSPGLRLYRHPMEESAVPPCRPGTAAAHATSAALPPHAGMAAYAAPPARSAPPPPPHGGGRREERREK